MAIIEDTIREQIEELDELIDKWRRVTPQTEYTQTMVIDLVIERQALIDSIADTGDL